MTELEKIKRAQMYIRKLAEGINPIDDTPADERDIINNVRLSRCFFYVADILGQVIDNGGVVQKTVYKDKNGFSLTEEEKALLDAVDTPLQVREITGMINALKGENYASKLKVTAIGKFLTQAGLLEIIEDGNGKNKKIPTALGESMGIIRQTRTGQYGTYDVLLYTREAQQFIFDNIDAVIEVNNTRTPREKKPRKKESFWSYIEDECLKDLAANGATSAEIASALKKSEEDVIGRMAFFGL